MNFVHVLFGAVVIVAVMLWYRFANVVDAVVAAAPISTNCIRMLPFIFALFDLIKNKIIQKFKRGRLDYSCYNYQLVFIKYFSGIPR